MKPFQTLTCNSTTVPPLYGFSLMFYIQFSSECSSGTKNRSASWDEVQRLAEMCTHLNSDLFLTHKFQATVKSQFLITIRWCLTLNNGNLNRGWHRWCGDSRRRLKTNSSSLWAHWFFIRRWMQRIWVWVEALLTLGWCGRHRFII